MPRLTKRVVDSQQARETRYFVWDDGKGSTIGFGLIVHPSGTKSYCYQYRTPEGQTRRFTIGTHGVITADQARDKAEELASAVSKGRDPQSEKLKNRKAITVAQLLDLYLDSPKFSEKAELTQKYDSGRVERHLKPLLGRKIAEKLTADEIRKAGKDITAGKTAKTVKTGPRGLARVTGGPGASRMAIRLLKSAFSWAFEQDLINNNNPAKVKTGKDRARDIRLFPKDYEAIFGALDELENTAQIRRPVADAIRVIALTGARRNEIAGLRWRHINSKEGKIELATDEHKTGKKTGKVRVISLPTLAQEIISRQPRGDIDDFVFPPVGGVGPINLGKPWRRVREKAGISSEFGLHVFRHSLASIMADSGSQAAHIMAVMGHESIATSQIYVHAAEERRSTLAEQAASGISAALKKKKPGELVKLK